jgi:hypothetical protein
MRGIAKVLGAALVVSAFAVPVAQAGDVLFYYGHAGLNEGHTQLAALIAVEGGTVDFDASATLPTLTGSDYNLVFISVPGLGDSGALFSAGEKADIISWQAETLAHRLVLIGEWDGFYGAGQAVLIDLVNDVNGGTGIAFIPGVYDSGCNAYSCGGALGTDPLVTGLDHVCKAATAVWDEGSGAEIAFPVENTIDPWIVGNGTLNPCIIGIGDSNLLSDGCSHLLTDADSAEFARRLYTIDCAGDPVPTFETSWGHVKSLYR